MRRLLSSCLLGGLACLAGAALAAPAILVEASVVPNTPVVGQQVNYELRVLHRVALAELRFSPPAGRLAEVRSLDAPPAEERVVDGQRYRVQRRQYAVFPFASGAVRLEGGRAAGRSAAGEAFDLPTSAHELNVQPAPPLPEATPWLPAKRVSLRDELIGADRPLAPGDVVRRRLSIEAVGADAGALPELSAGGDDFRIVAAEVKLSNRAAGPDNVALREQIVELQPKHGGELRLPEIRLSWWDTQLNGWAEARLAARTLEVRGLAAPPPEVMPTKATTAVDAVEIGRRHIAFVATFAGVALLALAGAIWLRAPTGRQWRARRRVGAAARRHDTAATKRELLAWAAQRWPAAAPATLGAMSEKLRREGIDSPAREQALGAIEELSRQLYGPATDAWNGSRLAGAVRGLRN